MADVNTFNVRVSDYVGTFTDTLALGVWLTAAAQIMVDALKDEIAMRYATRNECPSVGLDVTTSRVVRVTKSNYLSLPADVSLQARLVDENSIYYAFETSPRHYIAEGKLYVVPDGGEAFTIDYPTVTSTDTTIAVLPNDMIQAVVLWTSIQAALSKFNELAKTINDETIGTATAPTAPDAPDVSDIAVEGTLISDPTPLSLGTAPTYTAPTMGTSYTDLDSYIGTHEDLELAQAEAQQQSLKIEEYGKLLYNSLNNFNKELEIYKATLQKNITQFNVDVQILIENARITNDTSYKVAVENMRKELEEYALKIQRYAQQVTVYGIEVNKNVQYYMARIQSLSEYTKSYASIVEQLRQELQLILSRHQ